MAVKAPEIAKVRELIARTPPQTRGGAAVTEIAVRLKLVTPMLGGAARTRTLDDHDPVRVPSIRGHLRFWWRALYGRDHATAAALYDAEAALWGRPSPKEGGGRSPVEVRVEVHDCPARDLSPVDLRATTGYALFPAREPFAPRRPPGTTFTLKLRFPAGAQRELVIKNVVRAWVLFGGLGGRTRRGLGTLAIVEADAQKQWLPDAMTPMALKASFGFDPFAASGAALDLPRLQGATLVLGATQPALGAWETALKWLRDFRQSPAPQGANAGGHAREAGNRRPGRSNWPEPDKIRALSALPWGNQWAHPPRHNAAPAWPRAAFGLPIVGRFQSKDGNGQSYGRPEPEAFQIRWWVNGAREAEERLASALVVKAMQLQRGQFVPVALWLNRSFPANARVGLAHQVHGQKRYRPQANTGADFDVLQAHGDAAHFNALVQASGRPHPSLRAAFFAWLLATPALTQVTP